MPEGIKAFRKRPLFPDVVCAVRVSLLIGPAHVVKRVCAKSGNLRGVHVVAVDVQGLVRVFQGVQIPVREGRAHELGETSERDVFERLCQHLMAKGFEKGQAGVHAPVCVRDVL